MNNVKKTNKKLLISSLIVGSMSLVACGGGGGGSAVSSAVVNEVVKKATTEINKPEKEDNKTSNAKSNTSTDNGISTTIPKSLGSIYQGNNFNRYTSVKAPNGGSIHIVAQDKLTDEQII